VPIVPIEVDVILCPTLSLMGIDRGGGPDRRERSAQAGVASGDRIGIVGWKALLPGESTAHSHDLRPRSSSTRCGNLRAARARARRERGATSPSSACARSAPPDQIAIFEYGASRCSAWVMEILRAARPGVSERETFRAVPWAASRSATTRCSPRAGGRGRAAEPVVTAARARRRRGRGDRAVGRELRTRRSSRWIGGRSRQESDGYLSGLPSRYWRTIATWYASLRLGAPGRHLRRNHRAARRRGVRLLGSTRAT